MKTRGQKSLKAQFIHIFMGLVLLQPNAYSQQASTTSAAALSVTPVPENFNGLVGSAELRPDLSIDLFAGFASGKTGGSFDRTYNGISGQLSPGDVLSDESLNELTLKLSAPMYGITELGPKYCKPVGTEYPSSVVWWFVPAKHYLAAERTRDLLMKQRISHVEERINALTNASDAGTQLQAIKLQVESLNALIDGFSGSSLYSLDNKASEVRATSRIAWREKLLVAIEDAKVKAQEEELKLVGAAQQCSTNVNTAINISWAACQRTKPEEQCSTDAAGVSTCTTVQVPDPVPGSCDVSQIHLPLVTKSIFVDIVKLYSLTSIPSRDINERYVRLNDQLNSNILSLPRSNAPEFDWSTPLEACLNPKFGKYIKDYGMACVANHTPGDYDASQFSSIATTNDPIHLLARETLGVNLNTAEYIFLVKMYQSEIATGLSHEESLMKIKLWMTRSPLGVAYATGVPLDATTRANYDAEINRYATANNINLQFCTPSLCNSFPGPKNAEPNFNLAPQESLSADVVTFLSAIGIPADQLEMAKTFFNDSWGKDDLNLGHSRQRLIYFDRLKPLIVQMLEDDRKRLANALVQRSSLLDYHQQLVDLYLNPNGKKRIGTTQSVDLLSANINGTSSIRAIKNGASESSTSVTNQTNASAGSMNKSQLTNLAGIATASDNRLVPVGGSSFSSGSQGQGSNNNFNSGVGSGAHSVSTNAALKNLMTTGSKLVKTKKDRLSNSPMFAQVAKQEALIPSPKSPSVALSKINGVGAKLQTQGIAETASSIKSGTDLKSDDKNANTLQQAAGNYNSYLGNFAAYQFSNPRNLQAAYKPSAFPSASSSAVVANPFSAKKSGSGSEKNKVTDSVSPQNESEGKIADAIWHMENSKNKDVYESTDEDSLFEMVTKAHIRNYHRILNKR